MFYPDPVDLAWWITMVELPVMAGLFWLIWRVQRDSAAAIDQIRHLSDSAQLQMRESLAAFKLEVAKTYASISYIKDVERRLTDHLLRIEAKLDVKTESGGVR